MATSQQSEPILFDQKSIYLITKKGPEMKFSAVSSVFEQIEAVSGRLEITRLLADLLKDATGKEASIICNLSIGQLHAPYIGTKFNLAEKNLIKSIALVLDETDTAIAKRAKEMGDLGAVVAQGTWRTTKEYSITQVYEILCHIEQMSGTGVQEEKILALKELLQDLDPASAKYVVRIILDKLRLGFSDMTIIDALSWMAVGNKSLHAEIEDAYNVCADIGLIAQTLKEGGIAAIKQMHMQVGIPVRPAAAERLPNAQAIVEKLGPCVAQPKLDGFRVQIHVDNTKKEPEIHFFSRNLQDFSSMFPDIVDHVKHLDVQTLIAEGEAIGYDPHTGVFLPFQETVKRKRKHGIEEAAAEFPLKFFLFDILYLNGKELLDETHAQRRAKLVHLTTQLAKEDIQVIEEKEITTPEQLEHYFTNSIAAGLEGLVVKRPDAIYQPGKRNFNWIKLKRSKGGELEDTIDTVILGYYAGEGKRAQFGVGAFLVGVYNKSQDCFETIAKVGTGLTDDEWRELKKRCDNLKVKEQPKNVVCDKVLIPDVWTSPEIVCQIKADEITMSPVHSAGKEAQTLGYALRFPRFMGYRTDKSALESTTVAEIKRLYEDQFKG